MGPGLSVGGGYKVGWGLKYNCSGERYIKYKKYQDRYHEEYSVREQGVRIYRSPSFYKDRREVLERGSCS